MSLAVSGFLFSLFDFPRPFKILSTEPPFTDEELVAGMVRAEEGGDGGDLTAGGGAGLWVLELDSPPPGMGMESLDLKFIALESFSITNWHSTQHTPLSN
jgi:hypothetical protein